MKIKRAQQGRTPAQFHLPLFNMSGGDHTKADDAEVKRLDISQLLVVRPDVTFFVRVEGETMDDASIQPGDILVVDRSLKPRHNDTVIAIVNDEFTVRVLHKSPRSLRLVSRGASSDKIDQPFEIWGVVVWVVHKTR